MKPTTLLLALLIGILIVSSALPAAAERTRMKRNITFVVRKPDKAKNIALRFHVNPKLMTELNAPLRKRQMVYPGKTLVIPVWLTKKKGLLKESSDFNIAEYELPTDSLDPYIKEDFVNMAEIEADTVRRAAIGKELKALDRKLFVLYVRQDSVQKEVIKSYADMSLREQKRAMIERMRKNPDAALDAEIDAVQKQKDKLNEEKNKINSRVMEYEYLIENAGYAAAHPEEADIRTINIREWGDDPAKAVDHKAGKQKM
jgi:hypothetical protein